MGQDKSLLPFGGYDSLCEYQFQRLRKYFEKVYIGTKEQKFSFDAPIILDRYPQSSPLVGLVSIFETIEEDECFILSVDAPFVDGTVIEALYEASTDHSLDAIIASSPQGRQPLCGIYRRSIMPDAKQFLRQDKHKLNTLLNTVKSHFVYYQEEKLFGNLNHPHEYEAALETLQT